MREQDRKVIINCPFLNRLSFSNVSSSPSIIKVCSMRVVISSFFISIDEQLAVQLGCRTLFDKPPLYHKFSASQCSASAALLKSQKWHFALSDSALLINNMGDPFPSRKLSILPHVIG